MLHTHFHVLQKRVESNENFLAFLEEAALQCPYTIMF
jgi:hypothetical protein